MFGFRRDDKDDTKYLYVGGHFMAVVDETKMIHCRWGICLWTESSSHGSYVILVSILGVIQISVWNRRNLDIVSQIISKRRF